MDSPKCLGVVASVFVCLAAVCADPSCQIFEGKEVVCSAGSDDYILQRGLVSDFSQATRMTLRSCRIIDVEAAAIENVFFLQYIDLSDNKLTSLKPGVLDGNSHVTHLNLSQNMLTTFPPDLFVQKYNLETLDLRGNRINSLPMDVFVSLKKLKHLDLSYNDFLGKDLNPFLFAKNRKIKRLDLSRNDMFNSPDNLLHALQELDFLNLDRCSLKEVPQFATKANLRTMKHLSLSTNQVTQIDQARFFMNLGSLEILNLAENLIENVDTNAFIHLKKIKVIILRNNRLKVLPEGFFRNLINLWFVDLSHNSLEYVPLNAFRGTSLNHLDLSDNRFSYLEAYFCAQLRNTGIKISKFYFNDNPWQCACLSELLSDVKSNGIEYNRDNYDGTHPVCVTTKIFTCKRQQLDNNLYVEMYDNAVKGKITFQ